MTFEYNPPDDKLRAEYNRVRSAYLDLVAKYDNLSEISEQQIRRIEKLAHENARLKSPDCLLLEPP